MKEKTTDSITNAIARYCQSKQIRLTAQRKKVLCLIEQNSRAITAYDLLEKLKTIEPNAKPPTVYRALDFFIEHGFVHKVESVNRYLLCDHFDKPAHTSVLFICKQCQEIDECCSSPIEQHLRTHASQHAFMLQHCIVEIIGICSVCQTHIPE